MRQGSLGESFRCSLTINVLISQQANNLAEIGLVTFGLDKNHFVDVIIVGRDAAGDDLLAHSQPSIQVLVNVELQRLCDGLASHVQVLLLHALLTSELGHELMVLLFNILPLCFYFFHAFLGGHNIGSSD